MFTITLNPNNTVSLVGRFDAAQTAAAAEVLDQLNSSGFVDFAECTYIASAGLGILFATQKRLHENQHSLVLRNLSPHLREVFQLAGFDKIFTIEDAD